MNIKKWITEKYKLFIILIIPAIIILIPFVVKFLWSWTIPDLFPGATEEGLIAANISWYTAFKLFLLAAIIGGASGSN